MSEFQRRAWETPAPEDITDAPGPECLADMRERTSIRDARVKAWRDRGPDGLPGPTLLDIRVDDKIEEAKQKARDLGLKELAERENG